MIDKIKGFIAYIKDNSTLLFSAVIGVLGALLFRQERKNEQLESSLTAAKITDSTQENDNERKLATDHAAALTQSYDELLKQYENGRGGGKST